MKWLHHTRKNNPQLLALAVVCCLFFSLTLTAQGFIIITLNEANILLRKIDKPHWEIGYSFVADCPAEFKQQDDELKELVTEALQVWLQPLRELRPARAITADFRFVREPDTAECLDEVAAQKQFDAYISFGCGPGGSSAWIGGILPPYICIRQGDEINRQAFSRVLAHELGHAFGLGDTYIHGLQPSTGGLARTAGKQPSSIMSGLLEVDPPRQHPYLKEDDKNGIIWLYKHIHEGELTGDCFFPDYVPVKGRLRSHVCEPRYPLIFEAKHGAPGTVTRILLDDPVLDLNARDIGGNTALHYAVQRNSTDIVKTLLAQASIKVNITNKNGRTPAKLARKLKLLPLAVLIEKHPTAKLPPWDGEPSMSLATTWGALKRKQ